jgi:hypothetical protein
MNPTDDLPRAVANWVSMVIQQLNAEQTEVLRSCLEAPGPDVRVVFACGKAPSCWKLVMQGGRWSCIARMSLRATG